MVTSRSLIEAFKEHRGDPLEAFDFGDIGLSGLLDKEEAQFSIEVDVELSKKAIGEAQQKVQKYRPYNGATSYSSKSTPRLITESLLRYRLCVAITPKTGVLQVKEEYLGALKSDRDKLRPDERRKPFLELVDNQLRLRMEGQARPTEYQIGLNYTIVSQPLYPPHYPHLVAFQEEVSRWRFYYLEPHRMREENPVKEVETITSAGEDLAAFYYTLQRKNKLQFDNILRTLKMLIPTVSGLSAELTEEGKIRLLLQEHGVDFSAKVISVETLRVLGLIAILSSSNPATVVCFEEPENGVHPRRLRFIAELLRNASEHKQIIVNTHSPLLPDYLQDAQLVRCVKQSGHTVFESLKNAQGLFKKSEIEDSLDDKEILPSERILRGDWE